MTGHSSEAQSSDEYYTSTSDTEPEDESAAQSEIDALAAELQEITNKNAKWEVCVCRRANDYCHHRLTNNILFIMTATGYYGVTRCPFFIFVGFEGVVTVEE